MKLTEVLSLLMGPSLEFSGETSADLGDSLKAGGKVGIGYQFSDDLRITLGVVVSSEIEDDVYIQPLVHFDWSITDDVRLGMHADASRGGDVRLGYTFFEDWTVAVGGGFRRERFRLNDDGPSVFPFDRRDGVGEEEATVLSARLSYAFTDKLTLEGYVGGTLDGEFRLENERGHRILKSDYDDAVYGGFRFELGF